MRERSGAAPGRTSDTREPGAAPLQLGTPAHVLALQRQAGNHAVSAMLARAPVAGPRQAPPRPLGESVVDVILRDAPALLPHLSKDWLERKQALLDSRASNAEVKGRWSAVAAESRGQYPGLDPRGIGPTKEKLDAIAGELVVIPGDVQDATVQTALLLNSEDILAPQPYNRAIEDRFRRALHAKLETKPISVTLSPQHGVILGWGDGVIQHTKGRIGFSDLMRSVKFGEAYRNDVIRAPEIVQLKQGLDTIRSLIEEISRDHKERAKKDAEHQVVAGVSSELGAPSTAEAVAVILDANAHPEKGPVERRLEELRAPRPGVWEWEKPSADLKFAQALLDAGRFEIALWAFSEAERGALTVAGRYERYEAKVMKGAGVAIKWLNRMKTAGTFAAGVATGGSSLAVQAGVAAGYSLLRDGAQQASEVGYGLRTDFDVGGLVKQAGAEGAMAYLSGVTQSAFHTTLTVRYGVRLKEALGPAMAERVLSSTAAGTAAFYTAPAGRVLNNILSGAPVPSSLEGLGDMIVDEAIKNAAMDLGLGLLMHGSHPTPDNPHATPEAALRTPHGTAEAPAAVVANSATVPLAQKVPTEPHVFELAGRAGNGDKTADAPLLDALGPWEDAISHLRRGTGPAAGIEEAMRITLLQRLGQHRSELAQQIGAEFGATPAGTPDLDLALNVKGDDAGTRAVRIKGYLDQLHPGWERRYRMAVTVDAGRVATVTDAIATLSPPMRFQIAQWQALTAEAVQLTRLARGAASPAQRAEILGRIGDPALRSQAESYAGLDAAATRQLHDRLLADTDRRFAAVDRHAPDPERVKQALATQMWANALDPAAYVSTATQAVVLGGRLEPVPAYEAVMDQVAMIHRQAAEAGGMRAALRRPETFKYVQRICDHLLATGLHDPRLTFLRNQSELAYTVERQALEVHHNDLGETPGVSDAFLADTHAMLDGLLNEQMPVLRRLALGEAAAGGAPPVSLPPLGPASTHAAAGKAAADPQRGLAAPESLERIADGALHGPAVAANADVKTQAGACFAPIASELAGLGVKPPTLSVQDLQQPGVHGRFDPTRNLLIVNERATTPDGKPFFDGTPLGRQRLRNLLLHESTHAEQYLLALRHLVVTERDPSKLVQQTGYHPDLVDAALKQPPLAPHSPEGRQAFQYYEEFLGRFAGYSRNAQDTAAWTELANHLKAAETEARVAQAALERIRWYELWKVLEKSQLKAKLEKLQTNVGYHKNDLDARVAAYWNLLHEKDARQSERLGAQVLGTRQLALAGRRHAEAKAQLEELRRAVPDGAHKEEVEALATALEAYSEALELVGANHRELGLGRK